ncbi:MAG: hypothetical protein HGB19_00045 [Chlorobiales bacterium]|jgi:tetratricopeptide (TPR) repeat protein|nr:hypothetical protein [Chlorobiales bacterium]
MVTKPIHKTTTKAKSLLAKLAGQPKAPAIINISELLVLQGELDSALKRLGDVRDTYANSYRYHLVSARANRDAGKYDNAKHHYEAACRLAPQNEVAIKELIELRSIPPALPVGRSGAMAPVEPYDTEVLEQEEPHSDDILDSATASLTPETSESAQANTTGLFLEEAEEEAPAPVEYRYGSAANIFEPGIEEPNETEHMDDLFLPEAESELDLEQMQQEAISDLFSSSSFSPEALQREAIRQIEAELGPISEDPFIDFDGNKDIHYATEPESPSLQGRAEADLSGKDLFDESAGQTGQSNDATQETLFADYDDDASSPKGEVTDTDEDDFADFKIDRNKLGLALKKFQPQSKDQETDSEHVAPAEKPGTGQETSTGNRATQDQTKKEALFDTDALLDDIDRIAADLSKLKFRPVQETNDPTPISEQRMPYSDNEEIKMPTRSLAQIFVSQGAYAKAIKVYESLIENDPENAVEYEAEIESIQQKIDGN